jgi:hypothetical protein
MAEGQHVLPETETAVPILCQPSVGKVLGVLGGRMPFTVLSHVGPDEGRFLLTFRPGRFANYFIEADGVPDNDRPAIKALFAKYDVESLE